VRSYGREILGTDKLRAEFEIRSDAWSRVHSATVRGVYSFALELPTTFFQTAMAAGAAFSALGPRLVASMAYEPSLWLRFVLPAGVLPNFDGVPEVLCKNSFGSSMVARWTTGCRFEVSHPLLTAMHLQPQAMTTCTNCHGVMFPPWNLIVGRK
jgi:hypothetical protein